jgi:hypothetical protein
MTAFGRHYTNIVLTIDVHGANSNSNAKTGLSLVGIS